MNGVDLVTPESSGLNCRTCHFSHSSYALPGNEFIVCAHPHGAAIEVIRPFTIRSVRKAEIDGLKEVCESGSLTTRSVRKEVQCNNWQEDYPLVFPDAPFTTKQD